MSNRNLRITPDEKPAKKEISREQLTNHIAEFLAKGGNIEYIPSHFEQRTKADLRYIDR